MTRKSLPLLVAVLLMPAFARAQDAADPVDGGDASVVPTTPGAPSTEPASGVPPPTMNVVSQPEAKPSSWGTQKTVAVVLGSVSLVSLGVGIGFGVSAVSADDDATHDEASRATAISTLGIVAGLVFLGAAVGLYLTAPKTVRSASSFMRITF